jgi:hypothetical protein
MSSPLKGVGDHEGSAVKATGEPDRAGEVVRQAGATAVAVGTTEGLEWHVTREHDGLVRTTKRLAHTSHWRVS